MFFTYQWNFLEILFFSYESLFESWLSYWSPFFVLNLVVYKMAYNIMLLLPNAGLKTNVFNAIITAVKFILLLALLVFVRGGIPRYRYDFLTKVGWIKFLSLILAVFLSSILLTYVL